MSMAKIVLIDHSCYSWLNLGTNLLFFYNLLLKLWSVEMETDCNSTARNSHLISLPGYTEGKKRISFFKWSKSVSYLSLSRGNQTTVALSLHRTLSVHERPEAPSRGQASEPQGWKEKARSPPPHPTPLGTVNSNLLGWNPHPLVQTHLRLPRHCHLIDSACVRGLGAVYTKCQASARQLSVSSQVVAWVASDVGGWKRVEVSGGEGGRSKVLPQVSENLIWPVGFCCLRARSCCCCSSSF